MLIIKSTTAHLKSITQDRTKIFNNIRVCEWNYMNIESRKSLN